ncbi:MAG: ABC transporter ATP-binding protein/permease [Planctomycetia bacterium]|nr:ABC transporter ATP-binding protein/permease [Planctomycetia bacterium]
MLALAWMYRRGCIQIILLQGVLLGLSVLGLSFLGQAIDVIRHAAVPGSPEPSYFGGWHPPTHWTAWHTSLVAAAAVLVVGLVRALLSYVLAVVVARVVQMGIVVALRTQVYDKLQRLAFRFFDRHTTGSIINRVTGDVQSVRLFVDGVVIPIIMVVLSLVVYFVYMFRLHAGLTLACLSTMPLTWWLSVRFSQRVRPAYERNRDLVDRMVLTLTENIRGVHVVKGFGREPEEIAKFNRASGAVREQQHWIFDRISIFTPTVEMLSALNQAVLLGYGGWLVIEGRLPLGSGLIVFSGLLQQFSSQVTRVAGIINSVQQSLTGARRVFEILDAPVEIQSPARPVRRKKLAGAIRFEHVSFGYDRAKPVLRNISLAIEPGECIALVGATGSGKTTLQSLVPRFYDPTFGRVKIDGIDVRRYDLDDLRRNVGVVFQESFLFSDTIAANIAFGRPDATREQIETAAKIAAAHEFIDRYPKKYDTPLREAGSNLSGGQRQRLAIARALLTAPPILLMDDPTASVDARTEHEILDAMDRAMQGRTTIVVAHRLSMLRRADRIVVLEDGAIVDIGTHAELLHRPGSYRHAARIQADFQVDEPVAGSS